VATATARVGFGFGFGRDNCFRYGNIFSVNYERAATGGRAAEARYGTLAPANGPQNAVRRRLRRRH